MATNHWGLENAANAVISGEGPQEHASRQVRVLGNDLVAQRDNLQLGFLRREGVGAAGAGSREIRCPASSEPGEAICRQMAAVRGSNH